MSTETDRNPSPPPEILKNEDLLPDRVGDSMYSKQWLYKTLMSIMGTLDASTEVQSNIIELDSVIEENSCTLWDMSANLEVAQFLLECGITDIFLEVIEKTKSPRLLEIVIGILGNMSSFDFICQKISDNKILLHSIICLSGTSDSPTLLQVFRLIHCGIANESSQKIWFDLFEESSFFMENIKFILENNLNASVLRGVLELLDRLLTENESYCNVWGLQTYAVAIVEAGKQLLKNESCEDLEQIFSLLNTLSQYPQNIETYAKLFVDLQPLFKWYVLKLSEEETLPQHTRVSAASSFFATYGTLIRSTGIDKEKISVDSSTLRPTRKIFLSAKHLIENFKENDDEEYKDPESKVEEKLAEKPALENTVEKNNKASRKITAEELEDWKTFIEAIIYAAKAFSPFVEKEDDKIILCDIINSAESEGTP